MENNNINKDSAEEGLTQVVNLELKTSKEEEAEADQTKPTKCDCKSKILPFIPLSVPVLFVVFVITTYVQAVIYGHVEPILPYISDAGTTPPEAAYFSQMLFIFSILVFLTGLIRYRQIKSIYYHDTDIATEKKTKILRLNKFSFIGFILTFVGLSSVACFRVTETFILHFLFAMLLFAGWFSLAIFETKISMLTVPTVTSHRLARSRLITLVIFLISFVVCMGAAFGSAFFIKNLDDLYGVKRLKWTPEDGGYHIHVVSSIFEWIVGAVGSVFIGMFYFDFKRCTVRDRDIRFDMNK